MPYRTAARVEPEPPAVFQQTDPPALSCAEWYALIAANLAASKRLYEEAKRRTESPFRVHFF